MNTKCWEEKLVLIVLCLSLTIDLIKMGLEEVKSTSIAPKPVYSLASLFFLSEKFGPFLDLCVLSLRMSHANLLCMRDIR